MLVFWHAEDSAFFHDCWECPRNLAIESDRIAGQYDNHCRELLECQVCLQTRNQHLSNDCCDDYPCQLVEFT